MTATLDPKLAKDLVKSSKRYDTTISRRITRTVMVGDIPIGSDHQVSVQSMINEDTLDIEASTLAIRRLHEIGCEMVRLRVVWRGKIKIELLLRQKLKIFYCYVLI